MLKEGCYYKLVFDEMDWVLTPALCQECLGQFGGGFRKLVKVTTQTYFQETRWMFAPKDGLINFFDKSWQGMEHLHEIQPKEILQGIMND